MLELAGVEPAPRVLPADSGRREPGTDRPVLRGVLRARLRTEPPDVVRDAREPAAHLAQQDVIYVGGGNTANMLAIWGVHEIDRAAPRGMESRRGAEWIERRCELLVRVVRHRLVQGPQLGPAARLVSGPADGQLLPALRRRGSPAPSVYTRLVAGEYLPGMRLRRRGRPRCCRGARARRDRRQRRRGSSGYRVTADGEEPLPARLLTA